MSPSFHRTGRSEAGDGAADGDQELLPKQATMEVRGGETLPQPRAQHPCFFRVKERPWSTLYYLIHTNS